MAPPARKGTALKKHRGADARAIVNGVFLDVENNSGLCHIPTIQLLALAVNIQTVYNMYIKEYFKDNVWQKHQKIFIVKSDK